MLLPLKYLIAALFVQVCIVGWMVVSALMPLVNGTPLVMNAIPVDPRDLMRGDYVRLAYDMQTIEIDSSIATDFQKEQRLRYGEVVYVTYQDNGDTVIATGVYTSMPTGKAFLRARSQRGVTIRRSSKSEWDRTVRLDYGIEEYYTDSETAKQIEKTIRDGKTIQVHCMVAEDGLMRIRALSTDAH